MKEEYRKGVADEEVWGDYLFKYGSTIGLNKKIYSGYNEFIANARLSAIGFEPIFETVENPIPWMDDWTSSKSVQVAPQETEISAYLTGQVNTEIDVNDLKAFTL